MKMKMKPVHPGEILKEDVLPELRLTKTRFAQKLGLSRQSLHDLLEGKYAISTIVALRLERLLGSSAEMWLNLQRDFDLALARAEKADELEQIKALEAA